MKKKKWFKRVAVVTSFLLISTNCVSAAGNLEMDKHIYNIKSGMLLEENEYFDDKIFDYDINSDGNVNVFDFGRMKNSMLYNREEELLSSLEIPQLRFVMGEGEESEGIYTIPVMLCDNKVGISAFQFDLSYDERYFELNDAYTDGVPGSIAVSRDKCTVQFAQSSGHNITGDLTVMYLEFKVSDQLPSGLYDFYMYEISASHLPVKGKQRVLFKEEYQDISEVYRPFLRADHFYPPVTTTTTPPETTTVTTTTTPPETTTVTTTTTPPETTTVTTTITPPQTTEPHKDKNGSVYFQPGQPQEDTGRSVIKIPVQMANNSIGVSGLEMKIDFNRSLFRIRDAYTADFGGDISFSSNDGTIIFTASDGKDIYNQNGTVAYVELEAITDIQPSLHQFSFSDIEAVTLLDNGQQWKIPQDKCPLTSSVAYFWTNGMNGNADVPPVTTAPPVTTITTIPTTTTPHVITTKVTATPPVTTTTKVTTTTPVTTTTRVTTTTVTLPDMPDPSLNADKVKIAEELSKFRVEQGLSSLQLDTTLSYIADIRANEIITKFSTTRPDGTKVSSLLKQYGLSTYTYHEYIIRGSQTSASRIIDDIKVTDRIIKGNFNKIGVGYVYSDGKHHWSLVFSKQ